MTQIAIIGTAGRDSAKPMTLALYKWMVVHARTNIPADADLVSGGAAWADHLAVSLFLFGHGKSLRLHLPAPFVDGAFLGPAKSAATAANYYHKVFSKTIGRDSLAQLMQVMMMPNVTFTEEPEATGYGGMFARNKKVAVVDEMYAYTFGEGDEPADGGTKNTWDLCTGKKTHVSLPYLY